MKLIYTLASAIIISTSAIAQDKAIEKEGGSQFTMAKREIIVLDATPNKTKVISLPFINDGTEPLIFTNKNSSCSCLATEMPKEVKAGEKGVIKVHFTAPKAGDYTETIYIQTNAKSIPQIIKFKASVE